MNEIKFPKFYVGQKIIAIRDHSQGVFKKGDKFIVKGLGKECCHNIVDIGVNTQKPKFRCSCGNTGIKTHNKSMFAEECFKPLQEQCYPLISYSKVLEDELVNAN